MTSQVVGKNCDGGHPCTPPKECCKPGCCYIAPAYRPPSLPAGNMFSPLFLGHWYFWLAVTATVAGILCACSLWRRHNQHSSFCCRGTIRDERASEPDSNGSCYAPPQYSRCNSFHQAPPLYSEVTSKPDLYPLVLSYNGEPIVKSNGSSTGYLMVQYFRNFIIRPVGTLSATSTIDSLSSSFICNAANEANTVIPPPYSCMGSCEDINVRTHPTTITTQVPRSSSSITCGSDNQRVQNSPSVHSYLGNAAAPNNDNIAIHSSNILQGKLLITNNPCFDANASNEPCTTALLNKSENQMKNSKIKYTCDASPMHCVTKVNKRVTANLLLKETSLDSESQEDDHNFSDLLNLSVCVSSANQTHLGNSGIPHLQQSYSVENSMTSSDISSLANLGTPDSPPRATSPTAEMRELLGKIQQLPQQKSSHESLVQQPPVSKINYRKTKAKTLYMPLNEIPNKNKSHLSGRASSGIFTRGTRNWLSRSAPNTPCDIFLPNFTTCKRNSGSQKSCKSRGADGSPLLNETEESDDEARKNSS